MRSEQEIKDRKLQIYDQREKFSRLIAKEPHKNNPLLQAAFDATYAVYSEKIKELNWVLNKNENDGKKGNN